MRTTSTATLMNPSGVSPTILPQEMTQSLPLPPPLHASEVNGVAFSGADSTTGSRFTTGVNLLGVGEHQGDDILHHGLPPQRRHVAYEYCNGLFVSRSLHNDILAKEAMLRERAGLEEAGRRIAVAGSRPRSHVVHTEDACFVVKRLLKELHRVELIFRALAAGAALFSLLEVLLGGRLETPLDDPLLLHLALVHGFHSSVFMFFFMVLLTAALAPLASGVADAQWQATRHNHALSADNHSRHQDYYQKQQKQQQRRHIDVSATFAEHSVNLGPTPSTMPDQGLQSVVTESMPVGCANAAKCERGTQAVATALNTSATSLRANSERHIVHRFAAAESNLARRLLQKSPTHPWRVLLKPIVWLYMAGLALTVVEIALTEDISSQDILAMKLEDRTPVAIVLLAIVCGRAALLLAALLLGLFI